MTALAANIDLAPTLLEIVGLPPNKEHDGTSFLPLLHTAAGTDARAAAEDGWRTALPIEYLSCGTYFGDHCQVWVSGPAAKPGVKPTYGKGPFSTDPAMNESNCPATEGSDGVGAGVCYFLDSTASNNWIANRVRNATHNYMYAESFGAKAMHALVPGGSPTAKGVFQCLDGDFCQWELYDYGPIESEYPNFPVMTDARWCLVNSYKSTPANVQAALHTELKEHYCSTRRLGVDRMQCGGDPVQ
jgi:hypothetical protein